MVDLSWRRERSLAPAPTPDCHARSFHPTQEEEHIDFFLANAIYMASSVASMLPRLPKFEFIQPALAALTGYSMPCQPVRACQPAAAAAIAN